MTPSFAALQIPSTTATHVSGVCERGRLPDAAGRRMPARKSYRMPTSNAASVDEDQRNSRPVRLDGWKAIAAYLGRTVRTSQRWAVQEQLPLHRHHHRTSSSVYAFVPELDAWRAARTPDVIPPTGGMRPGPARGVSDRRSIPRSAYEQYVRGRCAYNKQTLAGFDIAIRAFSRAIAIAPIWPEAYVALAETCLAVSRLRAGIREQE